MYIQITRKNQGFTLIELMVVIAIIGLLASTVLSSLQTARQRGQDAQRISEVRELMKALELYRNNNGGYPCSGTTVSGSAAAFNCTPTGNTTGNLVIDVKSQTTPTGANSFFRTAVGFQPSNDTANTSIQYSVGNTSTAGQADRSGYFIKVNLIQGANCIVRGGSSGVSVPTAFVGLSACTTIRSL